MASRRIELPVLGGRVTERFHPRYVVWELTLRCDQPCTHCGSRAGVARPEELSTERALAVVSELAALGAEEVVLIGGEAYLHPDFLRIVRALRDVGITPTMTTGGRGVDETLARAAQEAGLAAVSVSVDGLARTHDTMRASRGSFAAASRALSLFTEVGLVVSANTNVNRFNAHELEALYEHLAAKNIRSWQVQLTTPLGRAADRPDMILQPYDLLDVVPRVARLKERAMEAGILLMPGNNLGYFGPEEAALRSPTRGGRDHFPGCQAGRYVMGIESNGAVKGCPSLQSAHYVGGSVEHAPLASIWDGAPELAFARHRTEEALWGFCASCDFRDPCMGGCTFTAHAILGRPGNDPYCHYRARVMRERGLRERLVQRVVAPGRPFDNGVFDLVVEAWDAPEEKAPEPRSALLQIGRRRPEGLRGRNP